MTDPAMAAAAAETGAAVVVMHMRGEPRTMQQDTAYGDVVAEVREFLLRQAAAARAAGVAEIAIDPASASARPPGRISQSWPDCASS